MAGNVWNNSDADNDGDNPNNWSLGHVPTTGETMEFDGATTSDDCTFGDAFSCDGLLRRDTYTGALTLAGGVSTAEALETHGTITINSPAYLINSSAILGNDLSITGTGVWYFKGTGDGITSRGVDVVIDVAVLRINNPNAALAIPPGEYLPGLFHVQCSGTTDRTFRLSASDYIVSRMEWENTGSATLTIDLATNNPPVVVAGDLVVDIDSTGGVVVDAGSWTLWLYGDLINEMSGSGVFDPGGQDICFGDTADQSVDLCGGVWGSVEIDKAAGTVTATSDWNGADFVGTNGTFDPDGREYDFSGDVSWAAGFDFVVDVDAMNGCGWTVAGDFSADGQTLNASSAWELTVAGSAVAVGAGYVKGSDASGGSTVDALGGSWTDGGNNLNWDFEESSSSSSSSSSSLTSSSSSSPSSSSSTGVLDFPKTASFSKVS